MSLNLFVTLCILGLDFMIYAFFQWTYGDKRKAIARTVAAHRSAVQEHASGPILVGSPQAALGLEQKLRPVRARAANSNPRDTTPGGTFTERLA